MMPQNAALLTIVQRPSWLTRMALGTMGEVLGLVLTITSPSSYTHHPTPRAHREYPHHQIIQGEGQGRGERGEEGKSVDGGAMGVWLKRGGM